MPEIQTFTGTLTVITCCQDGCGVVFGLEAGHERHLRESHAVFSCPNGHLQHFAAETKAERLTRELAAAVASRDYAQRRQQDLADARDGVLRQLRSTKGVVTRIKNRIAKGVCPCCHRTFGDLRAHMDTKHPEFAEPVRG